MSFIAIGVTVGAVGLGYSVYNGIQTANAENTAINQQNATEQQQITQAQQNETNTTAENDADQQEKQQESVLASMGLGKQGWAGTILTSPLGVPTNSANAGTTGGKTILGQ
jgi:uncharacterized protein HemX